MIKGILLDIDNTLYDYNMADKKGFNSVCDYISALFNKSEFIDAFQKARLQIHTDLRNTASSHNRILYFQKTLELLNYNENIILPKILYDIYWNAFLDNIKIEDGVIEFLENNNKKICYLTDLTAYIQYRKLEKTGLFKYGNCIVTSEEAGIEKPDKKMFLLALEKLSLSSDEVCIIGDSYEKDISGALALDIKPYWKTNEQTSDDRITTFTNFRELIGKI